MNASLPCEGELFPGRQCGTQTTERDRSGRPQCCGCFRHRLALEADAAVRVRSPRSKASMPDPDAEWRPEDNTSSATVRYRNDLARKNEMARHLKKGAGK